MYRLRRLISQRLAVSVISILFAASALGWILTELIPGDLPYKLQEYRLEWGNTAVKAVMFLKLYDPFHSFWYRGVLALFLTVLLLCMVARAGSLFRRTFRISIPRSLDESGGNPSFVIKWGYPAGSAMGSKDPVRHYGEMYGKEQEAGSEAMEKGFSIVRSVLGSSGYSVAGRSAGGTVIFAAVAGRWRHMGNFLFHSGLLLITAGGIIGSFLGSSEMLYGKAGDVLPLYRSDYSIRVESFSIITSSGMQITDYISKLSVLDAGGNVVKSTDIEVNHPMRFGGYNIYQSSYYVDDEDFEWAKLRILMPGDPVPAVLMMRPSEEVAVKRTGYTVTASSFFPDFRMSARGPYSRSSEMRNPALQIALNGPGGSRSGYLFLKYPHFNTEFKGFGSMVLEDIEPVYYTGLQISSNPGAPAFIAGIAAASLGLLFLYILDYRRIEGSLDRTGLTMVASAARWKMSFHTQFEKIERRLREEIKSMTGSIAREL